MIKNHIHVILTVCAFCAFQGTASKKCKKPQGLRTDHAYRDVCTPKPWVITTGGKDLKKSGQLYEDHVYTDVCTPKPWVITTGNAEKKNRSYKRMARRN